MERTDPKKNRRLRRPVDLSAAIFFVTCKDHGRRYICNENKKKMINVAKIFEIAQVVKRFSITWISKDGRRIIVPEAVFTGKDSFYSKGRTMKIKCVPSGEVRTVKIDTIVEFNGAEVFI